MIILCALLCSLGCAARESADDPGLRIVATAFPEYDFARAVTGDLANLHMLLAPGASAHSYDPTPADILRIRDADLFLYTGGEYDVWVENLIGELDVVTLCMADYVSPLLEEGGEEGEYDPHIWTSPKNALLLLDAICEAICALDPDNAEIYWENADRYRQKLTAIDRELTDLVASAPRNKIVVADRFPFLYLANDYNLHYEAAFAGCSDQADASARTFARLVQAVENERLPYVYYVELSGQRVADAVAEQTGCGTLLLHSCHNVTRDDFVRGVTYADLMKQNLIHLRRGLYE